MDFFFGILAPDFRASLNAIATACMRLVTFLRPPDFNVPVWYSCITFLVLERPFVADEDRLEDVFVAIVTSLARPMPEKKCFERPGALVTKTRFDHLICVFMPEPDDTKVTSGDRAVTAGKRVRDLPIAFDKLL